MDEQTPAGRAPAIEPVRVYPAPGDEPFSPPPEDLLEAWVGVSH